MTLQTVHLHLGIVHMQLALNQLAPFLFAPIMNLPSRSIRQLDPTRTYWPGLEEI